MMTPTKDQLKAYRFRLEIRPMSVSKLSQVSCPFLLMNCWVSCVRMVSSRLGLGGVLQEVCFTPFQLAFLRFMCMVEFLLAFSEY